MYVCVFPDTWEWDSVGFGPRPEGGFHVSFLNALPKEEEAFKSKLLLYSPCHPYWEVIPQMQ